MLDPIFAKSFIEEHLRFWNSHHFESIISHYSDDVVLVSPLALKLVESGVVTGKKAVGEYFKKGLDAYPDLNFQLINCFVAINSICMLFYSNIAEKQVAEVLHMNENNKVCKVEAHYLV